MILRSSGSHVPSKTPQSNKRKDLRSRFGSTLRLPKHEGILLGDHAKGSWSIIWSNITGTSCY